MIALFVAVCATLSEAQGASTKEDEVFLDMGDGDFGDMPKPPAQTGPAAESTAPVENKESPDEESHESLPAKKPRDYPRSKFTNKSGGKPADPGLFVTTKVECPMRRQPASDSEQISTTKAPRKIWAQKVDENWVKVFTKKGEPGYLSTECFEK